MDLIKDDILLLLFCIFCTKYYFEDNFEDNELEYCHDYKKLINLEEHLKREVKYV